MKTPLTLLAIALLFVTGRAADIASPDGRLTVEFQLTADGAPRYTIKRGGEVVIQPSRLGLVRDDGDFTTALKLVGPVESSEVRDEYEILTAKRRVNTYVAKRAVFHLENAAGQKLDIVFQVSNDGVAFRYAFPETSGDVRRLKDEVSSFRFPAGARAWLQPMSVAKTGWSQVNPCYEEFYEKDIPVGTKSPMAGWVYPALFRAGETWIVVTEGSLGRNYCGTRLRAESPEGEYTVGFPDPRENFKGGAVNPESTLPWLTPWRIIAIGSLKTVTESMLGIDLADPAPPAVGAASRRETVGGALRPDAPAVGAASRFDFLRRVSRPGKASWSWPLLKDGKTTYDVQKRFIDYAADMGWRYCLIDALWDKQIGYEKVKELVDYARTKNVDILLWYNSAGDWCAAPQTPRDMMLTHESRVKEFERLKAMGVAGLKIDFFGGDGQSMIAYYHDILADAAPYGFQINFHGATLPRGWNRTYPQLMTMEAIKGLEYVTFEQVNADEEPVHATMLPFTRNIFDPMDFTPVVLDRIDRMERRTSSAFELATSVLFTSGIQHYAEIPEGMAKAPEYVRDFLRRVPGVWDDSKFIDGFPGRFVVMARQGDGRWYVAGINGETVERSLTLDLAEVGGGNAGVLIQDGGAGNLSFRRDRVQLDASRKLDVKLAPRGGFVLVLGEPHAGSTNASAGTSAAASDAAPLRISVHDPVMIRDKDTYYLFATGMGISVWSSKDMQQWKREKPVFAAPPAWAVEAVPTYKGHTWAPDIAYHDGKYYLYYSVSAFGKNTSAIGVATNVTLDPADPRFKWEDHGKVIQSYPGQTNWNAIDPHVIADEKGVPYMTFGSFWDGLKIVRLKPDRLRIDEDPAQLKTIASRKRDPNAPNPPAPEGNPVDAGGNAIEAPFVFKKDGYYYLFASIDYCCRGPKSTYKMIVGRSKNVTGPYMDKAGMPMERAGGMLVLAGDANWYGVGHNSVYTFDGVDYIVFHAYDAADQGRSKLRIEKLRWDEGWPAVVREKGSQGMRE